MIKLIIVFLIGMLCGTFLAALCFASKTGEEIYADVTSKLESDNKE